ncbi:MAG: hypothetical protein U9R79_13235 [Armatimonadota bacterium]|nr:hypothetical protein [Armatimonadota bacterium]
MAVQIGIIIVLAIAAVLIYRAGARFVSSLMAGQAEGTREEMEIPREPVEPVGPVGPDGLIVLFGDRFVDPPPGGKMVSPRLRCYAPLTEEELDAQHWALQILYACLVDLHEQGSIEMRVVDRPATLMPPFPQKTWELQLCQVGPMPESPISDALAVAFGLLRKRSRGRDEDEDSRQWVTLDAVIEQALKTMRQEMTFWERSGVYGDIRQYVESALIAQGYLIEPERPTWLDRVRSKRPTPHEEGTKRLAKDAKELQKRLAEFRRRHGGNLLPETPRETEALRNVDTALLCPPEDAPDIPLDEVLRLSIYETLMAIRQLEPSGDAGV